MLLIYLSMNTGFNSTMSSHAFSPEAHFSQSHSFQSQCQQLLEVRHAQARDGIPIFRCVPARVRNDTGTWYRPPGLTIDTITTDASTGCDISQGCEANGVEPWVQEAEGGLASTEAGVVEKGDNAGDDWS